MHRFKLMKYLNMKKYLGQTYFHAIQLRLQANHVVWVWSRFFIYFWLSEWFLDHLFETTENFSYISFLSLYWTSKTVTSIFCLRHKLGWKSISKAFVLHIWNTSSLHMIQGVTIVMYPYEAGSVPIIPWWYDKFSEMCTYFLHVDYKMVRLFSLIT